MNNFFNASFFRCCCAVLSLAAVGLLASCGGGSDDHAAVPVLGSGGGTDLSGLGGSWSAAGVVVGSSIHMDLNVQNSNVTGTGTYAMEAGRAGTISISGGLSGAQVTLEIDYDYGPKVTYSATLQDGTRLNGTATYQDGTTADLAFVHQ